MTDSSAPLVTVEHLQFRYSGTPAFGLAVDELQVEAGETLAIVGPSGYF